MVAFTAKKASYAPVMDNVQDYSVLDNNAVLPVWHFTDTEKHLHDSIISLRGCLDPSN